MYWSSSSHGMSSSLEVPSEPGSGSSSSEVPLEEIIGYLYLTDVRIHRSEAIHLYVTDVSHERSNVSLFKLYPPVDSRCCQLEADFGVELTDKKTFIRDQIDAFLESNGGIEENPR
ncbi:hypothetical protein Bca52824_000014 [Brassica carinata]|uniref:DEK-C domain-containing protein n=1 Tax=Brassica carinata TaxID=52824 RepID=A0A8X7WFK1_BRACI|nr:hypothetical protein Bca52824_000014 [Brassica carinata]